MTEETPDVVKEMRVCRMCHVELQPGQAHLSLQHCCKDLRARVEFLRAISQGQARELDWERTAIQATHRLAYILLEHFAKDGRVTLPRDKFATVAQGAGVTMVELENGEFEVVCVLPKKEESKEAAS